jgi:hypothetical protein
MSHIVETALLAVRETDRSRRGAPSKGEARDSPEMAPQRLEKIESAPGNGSVSEVSNPQDLVRWRAATVRDSG